MNQFGKFMHRFMRSRNIADVPELVGLVEESTGRKFDAGEVEASIEDEGSALAPIFFRSLQETFALGEEEMAEVGRAYMLCQGPWPRSRAQSEFAK